MENMSDVMIECSANYPTTNMFAEDGKHFELSFTVYTFVPLGLQLSMA
jgi:hypothetical protein